MTSAIDDYFNQTAFVAKSSTVGAMDEDPEQAADALDLEKETGVPAEQIYGDVDGFNRTYKSHLASQIIGENQIVADWLANHPMAPRVAHDDLGALDSTSQAMDHFHNDTALGKWLKDDSVSRTFMEGFGTEPLGSSAFQKPSDLEYALSHPALGAVAASLATPMELLSRTTSGFVKLGHEGLSKVFGESFANEAAAMAEWAMMRGDIGVHPAGKGPMDRIAENQKFLETLRDTAHGLDLADPWTAAGREPPVGIHPHIDEAKALQSKDDLDALDDALKEATKSATRERAPDLFADFIRSHIGDREIGIAPEAVRELYGDKPPAGDDNILGWVPDLDKRLASAELSGEDIRVPMADWLAKVEPDVAKQLHDDIRVRDDGLTANEGKIEAEPKTVINEPHTQVRGAAGLEPMFQVGDRRLTLQKKTEAEAKKTDSRTEQFRIHDENGKKVGFLDVVPSPDGKKVYVENVGGFEHLGFGPNSFGPSLTRSLLRQLKEAYPQMEEIGGFRISGARDKAGTTGAATMKVQPSDVMDPRQHEYFKSLLTQNWEEMGHGLLGLFHEEGKGLAADSPMGQMVLSELRRLVPSVESDVTHQLKAPGGRIHGAWIPSLRSIIVNLRDNPDPIGTARHESIHPLRRLGLIRDNEWAILEKAVDSQGWMEKYDVEYRWRNFKDADLPEEAVAEAFKNWNRGGQVPSEVHPIFQKIKDFFEGLRQKIAEFLGHDLSWEQIFEKIDSGEIGAREPKFEGGELAAQPGPTRYEREIEEFQKKNNLPANNREQTIAAIKTRIGQIERDRRASQKIEGENYPAHPDLMGLRQRLRELQQEQVDEGTHFKIRGDDFSARPEGESSEPSPLYDRGKALGVTQSHMDRMQRLIDKRNAEDLEASQRRAEVRQRRRSNKEYKERRTTLRDEAREDLESRPDIALDQFITQNKIKFDPSKLTDDQKLRLPKDYLQKKNGVSPDDIAGYFGYTSGDALVERLGMLTEDRRRSGMSQRDYLNRLIDVETDRRLNREFGNREQNILDEAKDQALSETQLNLVHEETLAYALKAGQEPQFTKEQVREMVKGVFNDTPVGQISSDRLLQTSGKLGKKIEEAGSKGDWAEAYRLSQQRNHAVILAKFARDFEREKRQLDRTAKTFRKREVPSVPAEYTNWVHDLLNRVGYGINRSVQDLAENIGRQEAQTLKDFVQQKEAEWMGIRELPVADFLQDPTFRKKIDDLSYSQFKELKSSIDALVKAGRDEGKIYFDGRAQDRAATLSEMRQKLATFGYKPSKVEPGPIGKWPKAFIYGLTNMETFMNRLDRADPRGVFNRFFYNLSDAANGKATTQREVAKMYRDLPKLKDLDKLVDSPLTDPMTKDPSNPHGSGTWLNFNRGNVIQMLLNAGNESNWKVLARGYGEDPVALKAWLDRNVTKEDIAFAEGLGKIFKNLISRYDNVKERMTGATVQKLQLKPIEFKLANGEVVQSQGWYHPLVADARRKTTWVQDPDTGQWSQKAGGKKETLGEEAFNFTVADGFTLKRTGAVYPLDLNFNSTPTTIKQMIQAIHFKEPIHEAQKIFGDPRFKEDVTKYYGVNYADGLMPYLRGVAGAEGVPSRNLAMANAASEYMRQNIISTYIGFNPYTVLKHGPTAAVWSAREVGFKNLMKAGAKTIPYDIPFLDAVRSLWGTAPTVAKMNHDFLMENFEEVARRERHWQDTIAGQGKEIEGATTFRDKTIQAGAAAVAWSDMVSAKATALATYNKALASGLSHGESISLGNRALRRAHGSTAETNLPPAVRGAPGPLNPWLTSLYGFFGNAMQRTIEIAHKMNDAYELGKDKEIKAASKKAASAFGDFMTVMIWPTIVEEAVTGIGTDDHRTLLMRAISAGTMGIASRVVYLRDIIHGLVSGHEPGVGLISSAGHDFAAAAKVIMHPKVAFSRQHAAKSVGDLLTFGGEVTGMMPKTVSNVVRYGISNFEGQEKPKSPADILLGASRGTQKRRVEK
jgi:hypothetical protein